MEKQAEGFKKNRHVMPYEKTPISRRSRGIALMLTPFKTTSLHCFRSGHRHECTGQDLMTPRGCSAPAYPQQLQSARWVYPSAEHTLFQHFSGTMHMAGEFARQPLPELERRLSECALQ